MASAALRYARILNGFSFLISSRSPISASTRAMARLFKCVRRQRGGRRGSRAAALRSRSGSRGAARRWPASAVRMAGTASGSPMQNRQPPPPAPQTLPPSAPAAPRRRQHGIDRRGRDAGREPLAVLPFVGHVTADRRPSRARSSAARMSHGDVADPAEAAWTCAVAVDVALGHFPVVDPGVARGVGVGEHEARLAAPPARPAAATRRNAVDAELHRRNAAVERRTVVLHAGRARR